MSSGALVPKRGFLGDFLGILFPRLGGPGSGSPFHADMQRCKRGVILSSRQMPQAWA